MPFTLDVLTFMCGCWKVTLELLTRAEYLNRLVGVAGNLCKLAVWLCRTDEKQICTVSFRAFSCDSCNKLIETTHMRLMGNCLSRCHLILLSSNHLSVHFSMLFIYRKLQNPWSKKIIEFILKVYIFKR